MPELVSRKEAKRLGLKKYYTGVPCPKGHVEERVVVSCACIGCKREWRKRWISRQPPGTEKMYRDRRDKAERADRMRKWKAGNKQRHCELNRAAHARRKVRAKGFGRYYLETGFIKSLVEKQNNQCACCFSDISKLFHIDHIMPIALGGGNEESNLQALCPTCNMQKGSKHPDVWNKERTYLNA